MKSAEQSYRAYEIMTATWQQIIVFNLINNAPPLPPKSLCGLEKMNKLSLRPYVM